MADTKTSGLTADTAIAADDLLMVVDVADTMMAPTGTNKKAARSLLQSYAAGTLTTDVKVQEHSATWNNAAVTFTGWDLNVTDTASNAASLLANVRLGGNSIFSVTKTTVNVGDGSAFYNSPLLNLRTGTGTTLIGRNGAAVLAIYGSAPHTAIAGWGMAASMTNSADIAFRRSAAGVGQISGSSDTTGAALEFIEQTAPAAPSANRVRLYAQDNGGGKTQLMALFATGAAQQVAIEP